MSCVDVCAAARLNRGLDNECDAWKDTIELTVVNRLNNLLGGSKENALLNQWQAGKGCYESSFICPSQFHATIRTGTLSFERSASLPQNSAM